MRRQRRGGLEAMATNQLSASKHRVRAGSGTTAYAEQREGPVALFVHGVLLNGHLWRYQLAHLSGMRRCIAVDLLAHGGTEISRHQDLSGAPKARMPEEV